ncbi:MAG: hypothetical protein AAGL69_17495 [Pseudomonadota bacterium]
MKRLTMILMLVSAGAPSFTNAGVFSDLPDVLTCSVDDPIDVQPWNELVFYVSALLEDGSVLYKSLTSNPVVLVVKPDGVVDAENLADCDNRSVAELRETGRARDF